MHKIIRLLSFAIIASSISQSTHCQDIDTTSFKILTRLSFYSFESEGEFLLHVPSPLTQNIISVTIDNDEEIVTSWVGKPGNEILRIPFQLNLKPHTYNTKAQITVKTHSKRMYIARTKLVVLPYKVNEVKTDRFTGGLIVNKLPFYPFGFYCYSPVSPTLPEEEIVKGFNMISPYQKITSENFSERKAYMDRCAQIGMKVHYNLLSVSGGGGVGSKIEGLSFEGKRERLINEIAAFRDHPALLGWYIADEPTGSNITPDQLEDIYRMVSENDPWHPVSIVFMAPFLASKKYVNALDIVMADPYPVPDLPVSMVGNITAQLKDEFSGKRPVWIVPQAFGGGELWGREPTIQEIRSMTWQSIIKGATGIQYFVRQGLNYFPKSVAVWNECGRIAMEVAELTPWLLSDEVTIPVKSSSKNILVSSRIHDEYLIVMAVNTVNDPLNVTISINGITKAVARSIFENRLVPIREGNITDYIAPFGSQVYLIDLKMKRTASASSEKNLLKDPGFEDLTSPGIPSACYARPGGDRGATYFIDSRVHHEGNHSLRLITPGKDKPVSIRFFPFKIKAGANYMVSIWAKADPEQKFSTFAESLKKHQTEPQFVEVILGDFGHARFIPSKEWRQFVTFVTIPIDMKAEFKTNLVLKMSGQGVAWFDQIFIQEN